MAEYIPCANADQAARRSRAMWIAVLGREKLEEDVTEYLYEHGTTVPDLPAGASAAVLVRARDARLDALVLDGTIPPEEAVDLVGLYLAWAGDTVYAIDDLMSYDDCLYRSRTAHTSDAGQTPDATPDEYEWIAPRPYATITGRANDLLTAWAGEMDATTKLLPRNLDNAMSLGVVDIVNRLPLWAVKDCAADLYSSLVHMTAYLYRSRLADGGSDVRVALAYETANLARVGVLPDDWHVDQNRFYYSLSMPRIIYGNAEWLRDGLLRITEVIGTDNPWFVRLESILQAYMTYADDNSSGVPYLHPTDGGATLKDFNEINGELLQVLARLYAATGTAAYLTWLEQIADYVLLTDSGAYIPTRETELVLIDHGGEIISGLCEALMCEAAAGRDAKVAAYAPGVKEMLDRVLAVGRYTTGDYEGIFYTEIDPLNGTVTDDNPTDTWGYIYMAHYTYDRAMYLYDAREPIYLADITATLNTIAARDLEPPGTYIYDPDYWADSMESMLYLANRITVIGLDVWLAKAMGTTAGLHNMIDLQNEETSFVEREYRDGSYGRMCCMYVSYLAQGVRPEPWASDLELSGSVTGDTLTLTVYSVDGWTGALIFDYARHSINLGLVENYPRLNEWPEWYTVTAATNYSVSVDGGEAQTQTGAELITGFALAVSAGETVTVVVLPL